MLFMGSSFKMIEKGRLNYEQFGESFHHLLDWYGSPNYLLLERVIQRNKYGLTVRLILEFNDWLLHRMLF